MIMERAGGKLHLRTFQKLLRVSFVLLQVELAWLRGRGELGLDLGEAQKVNNLSKYCDQLSFMHVYV